jgi:murein DD-endopeptidase MepM/ murein hydrolase activator NlpD
MLQLPRSFKPTHPTGGLPGYPAVDVFGNPEGGDPVGSPAAGVIRRQSGKSPTQGGKPGGPYGWSLYLACANGDDFYLTHFGAVMVKVGDRVKRGQLLGTVCNSRVSGKPRTSHIHCGLRRSAKPLPAPPRAPVFDVVGPKGNNVARRKNAKAIAKALPGWVRRFGAVEVRAPR